jgi:hypothetical protein
MDATRVDDEEEWITVNGAPIKIENGELQGAAGEKITNGESSKNAEGKIDFGTGFKGESGKKHIEKRQREGNYTGLTEEQYQTRALDLLQRDVGGDIEGYETKNGKVVRWDKTTNDYAIGKRGEKPMTMFPLRGGQERFDKLRDRDEKGDN